MQSISRDKTGTFWFIVGCMAVLFMGIPYLLLGQDAIVVYHDQLDGELIAYLLQAKHLFEGGSLPEFMNGASKTALIPPAPACVLLFLLGNGFWALVFMQVMGSLCGYVGMFWLIREATDLSDVQGSGTSVVSFIAMAVGVLYAYLPFLPVYGLSQYGLPLLVWCLIQIQKGKYIKGSYAYMIIYASTSSLVLVGFGVLGVMVVWLILSFVGKRRGKEYHFKQMLIAFGLLLAVYVVENLSLFGQLLGIGNAEASHKAEYVLASSMFVERLAENFLKGGQHSEDYHYLFLPAVLVVAICCHIIKVSKKQVRILFMALCCNAFFAFVAALWDSIIGVKLRSGLGALGAFQVNRLLWMAPCLWYLMLGCGCILVVQLVFQKENAYKWMGRGLFGVMAFVLGVTGVKVLLESNLKPNIQKLRNPEYKAISFNDYYAVGVLEQVETYIYEITNETQDQYRVVSLGIDPAAALYHGFFCLDGYSNNYSLEYKHAFRKILEPELNKSEYLKNQFDTWGNRVYLFSSECPGYYTIEDNGFTFQNYELNVEQLRKLGGKYILSAAYIANAETQGLELMRSEPFRIEGGYYCIYLYSLVGNSKS